jgi:hypothetical protein
LSPAFQNILLLFAFTSGFRFFRYKNRVMAGPLDIDLSRREDSSLIHFPFAIQSNFIHNPNANIHPLPIASTSPPLTTPPTQNPNPSITPSPELQPRQTANDCSNSIAAAVQAATVAASRSLQQADATAQQAIQQASISASAVIQQASASASNAIAAVVGSSSSAVSVASLAMASLQSSANAAVGSASASLVMVQVSILVREMSILFIYVPYRFQLRVLWLQRKLRLLL